jgi:anti-anti-sigma factor
VGASEHPGHPQLTIVDHDDCSVLSLIGEHDMSSAKSVSNAIRRAAGERRGVVVSVSETDFIDSSIVRELYRGDLTMLEQGRRLVLHLGSEPIVERVLHVGGVLDKLLWTPVLQEAIDLASQSDGRTRPQTKPL